MSDLIFYNSHEIFLNKDNGKLLDSIPGGKQFSDYFRISSFNISAFDRTDTVLYPLKTHKLPISVMPELKPVADFDSICDERAKFLMAKAKQDGRKLAVMYSGGVDSTGVLCALLKNCSDDDLRNHVVVLLSQESIWENPPFYYDHVIKRFNCISSYRFPYFLGHDDYFFISGENADQLFGSQLMGTYTTLFSIDDLFKSPESVSGNIIDWLEYRTNDRRSAEKWFYMFKKLSDNAPIAIDTAYKMFWWVNFTSKWQSVYVRMLSFSKNQSTLKLEENYTSFYSSQDFQLWALNNSDNLFTHASMPYKETLKKYIIDFTKDESYMNKPKIGSLTNVVRQKVAPFTIDIDMNYNYEYPKKDVYNYDNYFVNF